MPEYLAPGVYVEETSFRAKTIEGVSTSTAGFVGPCRFGPTGGEPELLTSFPDFERIYGGLDPLRYADNPFTPVTNFLAHAVRAFFEEGGSRLYVSRVFQPAPNPNDPTKTDPGIAGAPVTQSGRTLQLAARCPGAAGNMTVTFLFRLGPNILIQASSSGPSLLRGANPYDLVLVQNGQDAGLYWLDPYFDVANNVASFHLRQDDPDGAGFGSRSATALQAASASLVTVNVTVSLPGAFSQPQTWQNLTFHPAHSHSLTNVFAAPPTNRATELYVPLVVTTGLKNGVDIAEVVLGQSDLAASLPESLLDALKDPKSTDADRTFQVVLKGGDDGLRPGIAVYDAPNDDPALRSGFPSFEGVDDISIVAAPGSTAGYVTPSIQPGIEAIQHALIAHCEKMRYRIAVLDSPDQRLVSDIRNYRGKFDSKYAALYYPWVTILDPLTGNELNLPPSGFVAGIYARNDVNNGVHKAPANEVVNLAITFEYLLNKAQQDVLNPEGICCFRFFEGRGYRLWGARTITSDPEWKYVNLRRYFAYLEHSIDKGTQWVVFENNSEILWANVVQTVSDFLLNEWKSGHLMGDKPAAAYFVRCDRSTMTQNDIDNGRLICLIGVAPVRPAEFVIFRIGQFTADQGS
jgi:phage tail sheath protein FI